jgi:excisionase family DNA binding protein
MTFISIGKVCELLGISLSTAYRWLKSGKITEDFRTLWQHRRFNEQDLVKQFIKPDSSNLLTVLYARVSSHDQKADLLTQENKLLDFANKSQLTNIKLISDLGSGLNYKKKGLKQLLNLILTQQMNTLIVNHKDRLLRFGSELIFTLCNHFNIEVIVLEEKELSFDETLTHDVIELMTVFCAKLYGKRSHKNKLSIKAI